MNEKRLLDLLYVVEEELPQGESSIRETYFRLDEEVDERENELAALKRAKEVYEALYELGLENREQVGDYICDYAKKIVTRNPKDALGYLEMAASFSPKANIEYAEVLIEGTCGIVSVEEGLDILRGIDDPEAAYLLYSYHERFPEYIEGEEAKERYLFAQKEGCEKAQAPFPEDFDTRSYTEKLIERLEKGDPKAAYLLSKRQDVAEEERRELLLDAAENFVPEAERDLAFEYQKEGDYDSAKEWFERAGDDGLPECYLYAAESVNREEGEKEALRLYQKAAEENVPMGLSKVGESLLKKDPAKALRLLRKAYRLGERFIAPYHLGKAYLKEDPKKAIRYLGVAAEKGNIQAALSLAKIYEKGVRGIKKNPGKASRYRFLSGVGRD